MMNARSTSILAGALSVLAAAAAAQATSPATDALAAAGPETFAYDTASPEEERRALGLVRIGEDGIARENDAALDAYFAEDFIFHGPGGDMTYDELAASFAAMRAAFSDFAVTRSAIVVEGDMLAARTVMSGIFTEPFNVPPYGTIEPTGEPMRLELINFFRYDADGKLAEEWVQSDSLGFLRQLGVMMEPAD